MPVRRRHTAVPVAAAPLAVHVRTRDPDKNYGITRLGTSDSPNLTGMVSKAGGVSDLFCRRNRSAPRGSPGGRRRDRNPLEMVPEILIRECASLSF